MKKSTGKLRDLLSGKVLPYHNLRIPRHKVFAGVASRGKGTMGWFYGFKLHLIINHKGVELITRVRKNMKVRLLSLWNRAILKKRFIIEAINEQLKNISQIEHSRHRSIHGFMLNLIGGLIAYCLKDNKPVINLSENDMADLQAIALLCP